MREHGNNSDFQPARGLGWFCGLLVVIGILAFIGMVLDATTPKCIKTGCDNEQASGSSYCYLHKPYSKSSSGQSGYSGYKGTSSGTGSSTNGSSTSSKSAGTNGNSSNRSNTSIKSSSSNKSSSTHKSHSSYDDGYDDVYEDDDYDWNRYYADDDYASGVDDAMEDLDW